MKDQASCGSCWVGGLGGGVGGGRACWVGGWARGWGGGWVCWDWGVAVEEGGWVVAIRPNRQQPPANRLSVPEGCRRLPPPPRAWPQNRFATPPAPIPALSRPWPASRRLVSTPGTRLACLPPASGQNTPHRMAMLTSCLLHSPSPPLPAPRPPCVCRQAFSAVGAMQGAWYLATGQALSFSEQQVCPVLGSPVEGVRPRARSHVLASLHAERGKSRASGGLRLGAVWGLFRVCALLHAHAAHS